MKRSLKDNRVDYSYDINSINGNNAMSNLFAIYRVEKSALRSLLIGLFNDILKVQINYKNEPTTHEEMNEMLEHFWNTREVLDGNYKITKRISSCLTESLEDLSNEEFRGALISIIRFPEYFYISHEELSSIQDNPMEHLDEISMLNCNKSIFKEPGKELSLKEILDKNKKYIKEHCGTYDENFSSDFIRYLSEGRFKDPNVAYLMKKIKSSISEVYREVVEEKRYIFCSKVSSHLFPGTKSIIEDNFFRYESKLLSPGLEDSFFTYNRFNLAGNYDWLKLAFGLGPNYKLRNVVFTNAMLQNIGDIVRIGTKKAFEEQEKFTYSPMRTDSQSEKFLNAIKENKLKRYKVCFDISKYSDYLLSQIMGLVVDYISPTKAYAESLKAIFNMPVKVGDKFIEIIFGTGAGIKANFDCITICNMLMMDYAAYRKDCDIYNQNVVGDDIYVDTDRLDYYDELIMVYTHFNCRINIKKSKLVDGFGHISFCNKHFWVSEDKIEPWNGVTPGLWVKEIYSLSRLNSIFRLKVSTNQRTDISDMDKLFELNYKFIEREFKINKMGTDVRETYAYMKEIPYDICGLSIKDDYEICPDWVHKIYNNLDTFVFHVSRNSKVQELFNKYYSIFPDHPIIRSFMMTNGKYMKILTEIEECYQSLADSFNKENYQQYKKVIRKAIAEFGKLDSSSLRVSTKDRTKDYFNEDTFFKMRDFSVEFVDYKISDYEMDNLKEFDDEDSSVVEIYKILRSRKLLRDGRSNNWNPFDSVLIDLPNNQIARIYSSAINKNQGRYRHWEEVYISIFNLAYPDHTKIEAEFKYKTIKNLVDFIRKMKMQRIRLSVDLMDIFDDDPFL